MNEMQGVCRHITRFRWRCTDMSQIRGRSAGSEKHDAWEKLFTLTMFYGGKLCKNCQGVGGNSLVGRPSEGVSTFALVLWYLTSHCMRWYFFLLIGAYIVSLKKICTKWHKDIVLLLNKNGDRAQGYCSIKME